MSEPEILTEKRGALGLVTLNRPVALNALSHGMIRELDATLRGWAADDTVMLVILTGAGERAFCAGGDIKAAHAARGAAIEYFEDEYRLDRLIHHYPKPTLALLNGITMGGGFGLAGPCHYRVACERTVFAMPETGIGFFPDVGATYYLSRLPGQAGRMLAVTGMSIPAPDMVHLGLATHYVPAAKFPSLIERLAENPEPAGLLHLMAGAVEDGAFKDHAPFIEAAFSAPSVEDIMTRLSASGTAWGAEILGILEKRSPFSMKLALALTDDAADKDYDAVIARDYTVAEHILAGHDFYEGVRALLIDKDKSPRWKPATLADVSDDMVSVAIHSKPKKSLEY